MPASIFICSSQGFTSFSLGGFFYIVKKWPFRFPLSISFLPLTDNISSCGYFPDLEATTEQLIVENIDLLSLEQLIFRGYRHFGRYFFRPWCDHCRRCIPMRIDLEQYVFSRSARRLLNRNSSLAVSVSGPEASKESFSLFLSHSRRFERNENGTWDNYLDSFFTPFPGTRQLSTRQGDRLVGVMHFDETDHALSAVYSYYDDSMVRESPGTYAILKLIQLGIEKKKRYLYLGYFIRDNTHMCYKERFVPSELSPAEGIWHPTGIGTEI